VENRARNVNLAETLPDTMKGHVWTLTNGIMLLMFVFSAAVQFNDPDPVAWIAVYGFAATVCALEIRRRAPIWAPIILSIIALVWAASIFSRAHDVPIVSLFAEWEMRDLRIEEAREMYGLTLVGIWMLVIVGARRARTRANTQ
jgi:Transmembrane family 220, helix